jgi:hypothetical protein
VNVTGHGSARGLRGEGQGTAGEFFGLGVCGCGLLRFHLIRAPHVREICGSGSV